MKRHTSSSRRHSRQSVLEVRVMSPRLAWIGCLKWAGRLAKIVCVLGLLAGLGWGAWCGIEKAFLKNPDFRLRVITLNPNPVIDELGVATAAGINLARNPSLFDIDAQDVCRKLKNLPAIADAHVERQMPGTLAVSVVTRTPVAWIVSPGLPATRHAGSLLVDHAGVAYPCPDRQVESFATLPLIELPSSGESPLKAGDKIRQPELEHCCLLLDAARTADPDAMQWIESVKQVNEWSLLLVTRQGTAATFGLSDHARQIESLRAALDHAGDKGYLISTINLIPKYNIPITLRAEPAARGERAARPSAEEASHARAETPAAEKRAETRAPVQPSTSQGDATPAPRAKPTAAHAEATPPRAKSSSSHAEATPPRAKPVAARAEATASRVKSSSSRAESSPPRAKPVVSRAEGAPPRAIPLAIQDPVRGPAARRTRDSSPQRN